MTGERVYAALLAVLYPRTFRARFGADMRTTFARDHEHARVLGARALAGFWIRTLAEAARYGLAERIVRLKPDATFTDATFKGASMPARLLVDWRDAWRAVRTTPVITAMAVLSLGLGIGANTAIFSILNSLVLRTLPVREPQQLVVLQDGDWTNPIWEQIRDRQDRIGAGAFAWSAARFDLARQGEADPVEGAYASGGMFDVLGLSAARGRLLTVADDRRDGVDGHGVAVVSDDFWRRRLSQADDVVGKTITIERVPFVIVGVMPQGFTGLNIGRTCDIVIPIGHEALIRGESASWLNQRSTWWLQLTVRLRPGQTVDQANAALREVQPQIRDATIPPDFPPAAAARYLSDPFTLEPAANGQSGLRSRFQQPLVLMMIVVGAVLLIACANIANLMLARANARRRELTVRLALGASRARIARQLLWESVLMAAGGVVLGLGVARLGAAFLVQQLSAAYLDTSLDPRVLAFTAGVGLLTALVFGVVPSLSATRLAPYEVLKDQGRTVAGDRRIGFRNALVVVQVALSLSLIVAAGLFVRTFQSLSTVSLGLKVDPLLNVALDTKRSLTFATNPADRGPQRRQLFARLQAAAAAVPGVRSTALSRVPLLTGGGSNGSVDLPDGQPGQAGTRSPWFNWITPGWFQTYGVRIVAGRDFSDGDHAGRPMVSVVNEAFVRRYFNGQNPIGRRFRRGTVGRSTTEFEVIGVASDSAYRSVRDGSPAIAYYALNQVPEIDTALTLTVEASSGAWGDLQRRLGQALTNVDGGVAFTMRPFADRIRSSIAQERLVAILSGFFGGLALLLACVGLYGVTAYGVSQRRTEIGVRMALGAKPSGVVRLVLRRVTWLVGIGVGAGAAVSYWAAKYVAPVLLFGLEPRDARTFVTAALVLVAVGLVTAWLPARRAARIDPTQVLREG